ncbi:MAG: hypothetical protein LBR56_07760, partial [Sporomusaceae bacterium]|nr:hypothetical protein [Sporomusaceae bacterium]
MTETKQDFILILDFASQYSQGVARKVRECGVYCEIADYDISVQEVLAKNPRGIIFAGSFASMDKDTAPDFDLKILETKIPKAGFVFDAPENASLTKLGIKVSAEPVKTEAGTQMLRDFLFNTCGCQGKWNMKSFAAEMTAAIRAQVGDKKVLCALSGGIDSSVSAVLT